MLWLWKVPWISSAFVVNRFKLGRLKYRYLRVTSNLSLIRRRTRGPNAICDQRLLRAALTRTAGHRKRRKPVGSDAQQARERRRGGEVRDREGRGEHRLDPIIG